MAIDSKGRYFEPPFADLVTLGRIPGASRVSVIGTNPLINIASVPEDIWWGGGILGVSAYPFISTASLLEVVSDSASDDAAGVGMRTATLSGLDVNWNPQSEVITLAGTTPVATTKTWWRINSFTIGSAGTSRTNVGTVSIRDTGAGTVRSQMGPGHGFLRQCVYSVKAGFTYNIKLFVASVTRALNTNSNITIAITVRFADGRELTPSELSASNTTTLRHELLVGFPVPEKSDVRLLVTSDNIDATSAHGFMEGILFDNGVW